MYKPSFSYIPHCIRLVRHLTIKRHSSSKRWQTRQLKDHFTKEAVVQGLKSRAAFKLLQIDDKYRVFQSGQTVVDLGYAPGSWSQVAVARTEPGGRILGVDVIPAQPPKGVSTIQGNFLNPEVQDYVRKFVRDPNRGRPRVMSPGRNGQPECDQRMPLEIAQGSNELGALNDINERTVDVVLSDMSAPWHQTIGFGKRSLSDPYNRMMNTSGISSKDHAGSMDLCHAALQFGREVLRTGGHFICKFYQGAEEKAFERELKDLFQKVYRHKPESSRNESKESYFIGLNRR
ncbi:RlmE family RNA methyltransferase [Aspergillus saccharolyticus JOP 1030-1]|uniref:rRNA methyltransferase 2, mitochondrial n=1 Tax=Aspergillus saccharolyticus JOP 1030-1 TaxID=1450539 RepID=A0A318ZJG0_9EURO|nr:23S ribosomal RNA methyltransferase [Aspergillus saccharolyticus JOP 1030-1]PYH47711.1 23S ribosomal RNA methyltransferase [Aspergillus saccharolyticus JOP 1030-1]